MSANPSGKEKLLWYLIHDMKNQGLLEQVASFFVDYLCKERECEVEE